jgi:hypothetical protein
MHLIARYGTPAEFICDNGPPFQGKFKDFCDERGIHLRYITPGMPRSNGLAERAVKTVKYALKKHAFEEHNARTWCSEGLPNILLGYRITPQASTMVSPAQLLFAQDPAVNADKYAKDLGPIDYLALDHDEDRIVDQLRWRASLAAKLGAQVATNLRVAHDRNAARFKHLRSGQVMPRVYVYRPGRLSSSCCTTRTLSRVAHWVSGPGLKSSRSRRLKPPAFSCAGKPARGTDRVTNRTGNCAVRACSRTWKARRTPTSVSRPEPASWHACCRKTLEIF